MTNRIVLLVCVALALGACAPAASTPPAPVSASPLLVQAAVTGTAAPAASVIGYLAVDAPGPRLVGPLLLDERGQPVPRDPDPAQQIWLGTLPQDALPATTGDLWAPYTPVQVEGQIDGPGSFGPQGQYRYQIVPRQVAVLAPRELTIALLLANSSRYDDQLVRIKGDILASDESALLSEQVTSGGVPASSALQIKLADTFGSAEFAGRLATSDSGIAYGAVHVDGIWRDGMLYPLAVAVVAQ